MKIPCTWDCDRGMRIESQTDMDASEGDGQLVARAKERGQTRYGGKRQCG